MMRCDDSKLRNDSKPAKLFGDFTTSQMVRDQVQTHLSQGIDTTENNKEPEIRLKLDPFFTIDV